MSFSKSLIEKRDASLAKAEALVTAATAEARELSVEEDADITATLAEVRSLDEQIEKHLELEKRSAEAAELRKLSNDAWAANEKMKACYENIGMKLERYYDIN